MTTETTWMKIRRALEGHGLKQEGTERFRSNIPWRPGSNSMGLSVKVILPEGEYGAWKDHVADEGGSLYQLAERLGIETPERAPATPTKRAYASRAEYAEAHHVPEEAYEKAGWKLTQMAGLDGGASRPALQFSVNGQPRYRFLDGEKPVFFWKGGSKPAWYGLKRAVEIARRTGRSLVYVNGAGTVVAAQWYDIPACTVEGGEHTLKDGALNELLAAWDGGIIFALDSDYTGQNTARHSIALLREKGMDARNADLMLIDRGDLCDFRVLHGDNAYAELERRATVPAPGEAPMPNIADIKVEARKLETAARAATTDPAVAIAAEAGKLAAQVERIQSVVAPPRVVELHELAEQLLNPAYVRNFGALPIPDLAALVGPLEPELYVLYGATGMGKSWLASTIAASLTRTAGAGLVVTTEMKPKRFLQRMACHVAKVNLQRILDGEAGTAEIEAYQRGMNLLAGHHGRVVDMSSPTPKQVVEAAKRAQQEIGMGWLLVDSATRMSAPGETYERMSAIANGLQDFAREFDVPVIATSQIGRDVNDRAAGKRMPRLDDGYGSGAIEHNAGVVVGMYRHSYYVAQNLEELDDVSFPPNTTRLILLKHRHREVPATPWCTVKFESGSGFYPYQTVNLNRIADIPGAA